MAGAFYWKFVEIDISGCLKRRKALQSSLHFLFTDYNSRTSTKCPATAAAAAIAGLTRWVLPP
ncbi:hypothetical protein, partial [Kingella oralis]|uniref:hypothetical protein n=1 Tax=Kingella oralis TaxID=505 RepID=UPI002D7EB207